MAERDQIAGGGAGVAASGTALFVRRPVLAFVLNALIVLAGLAGLYAVEVRELPDVDSPVVSITTTFGGASPETVDREVTAVLEGAASRVNGVKSISSASRFGLSRVTVEFRPNINLDVGATDLRDAVARVQAQLPTDADPPQVIKADANADAVLRIGITSASRSPQELTQLVKDQVEDRLLAADGVADVQIYGERDLIFRVDVDQMQLASRGLTIADLRTALRNVSVDAPAGSLRSAGQTLQVRSNAALTTEAEFAALPIAPDVTLGDVAQVTLAPDLGTTILRADGQTGIGLGIIARARSNALDISAAVGRVVVAEQAILPKDVRIFITSDDATFIRGAIAEVERALLLSVLIVVAIIYLFLQDLRATLIPALALPVSLIGTVAAIWLVGFSINILTLLALVLATGMVVDDAIVVLENIVRRRAEGMGARAAAVLGTRQVFFAVIATTTTLAAVFIPLSFLPGQTGGLFREFGFTLAISVLLSSITALTLCPVLASRLLRPVDVARSEGGPLSALGHALGSLYAATLRWALNAPLVVLALAGIFALVAWGIFTSLRQELTPPEDRAQIRLVLQTPQGVPLDYTDGKMRDIEDRMAPLRATGEVKSVFSVAGTGGRDNTGFMFITLADWAARTRSQQEIVADLTGRLKSLIGIRAIPIQANSLGIRGAGQGLAIAIVGNSYAELAKSAQAMVDALETHPELGQIRFGFDTTQPQLEIAVDRARAADLGVDIDGLSDGLQGVLDGHSLGTAYVQDKSYDIKVVSSRDPVKSPADLERIFLKARDGTMVPISSFVTMTEKAVSPELSRESQMRSVPITAGLTPAIGLSDALAEVRGIAATILPPDQRVVPLAEAATLGESASGLPVTFGFAILVVLLVLAAQFESFVAAFIIMATVPLGLACAVYALWLTGGSVNVYSQIGLVLLVGIMAKNGILIVEFANQLRDHGAGVRQAIEDAARIRLRPVMMTMVATVLGGLPLVFAHGPGAEARSVLGWIIVGGLGLATIATLYLTPVAYLLFAGLSRPRAAEEAELTRELAEAAGAGASNSSTP